MKSNGSNKKEKRAAVVVDGVQNYSTEDAYVEPSPLIKEKLEGFKDMKLGVMVHWGLYNQLEMLPSWGMVDAEARWSRKKDEYGDYPYRYSDARRCGKNILT